MLKRAKWTLIAVFAARVAFAEECAPIDDAQSLANHPHVFFAVIANYTVDASSGRIELILTHTMRVKGDLPAKVTLDPKRVEIKPLARHLFFVRDDGVVLPCSGTRAIRSSEFRSTWESLQTIAAPPLPVAGVASNYCRHGGFPRMVTLYEDGTVIVDVGTSAMRRKIDGGNVAEIRRLQTSLDASREGVGWLSYIPPGIRELTLYLDRDESWSGGPAYSKCGAMSGGDRDYLTPRRNEIVEAILSATGERESFASCGCVDRE